MLKVYESVRRKWRNSLFCKWFNFDLPKKAKKRTTTNNQVCNHCKMVCSGEEYLLKAVSKCLSPWVVRGREWFKFLCHAGNGMEFSHFPPLPAQAEKCVFEWLQLCVPYSRAVYYIQNEGGPSLTAKKSTQNCMRYSSFNLLYIFNVFYF